VRCFGNSSRTDSSSYQDRRPVPSASRAHQATVRNDLQSAVGYVCRLRQSAS
jgi:hypothetical protein